MNYPINELYIANKITEHYKARMFWLYIIIAILIIVCTSLLLTISIYKSDMSDITCTAPPIAKSSLTKSSLTQYQKNNIIMPEITTHRIDKGNRK